MVCPTWWSFPLPMSSVWLLFAGPFRGIRNTRILTEKFPFYRFFRLGRFLHVDVITGLVSSEKQGRPNSTSQGSRVCVSVSPILSTPLWPFSLGRLGWSGCRGGRVGVGCVVFGPFGKTWESIVVVSRHPWRKPWFRWLLQFRFVISEVISLIVTLEEGVGVLSDSGCTVGVCSTNERF